MFDLQTIETLIRAHGLMLLSPLAIIEGPIVTVIAAWLARLHYFPLSAVCVVVILADLVGDIGFYALGRWAIKPDSDPPRWLQRLGLNPVRLEKLTGSYQRQGGRLLAMGKFTHTAGAVVLTAAGMARMPFASFMLWNTLATIPKCLLFVAIGWSFGHIFAQVNDWLLWFSLAMLALLAAGGCLWYRSHQ